MASNCLTNEQSIPCLASFFDAMFGVKKLLYFLAVNTCPTLAFQKFKSTINCCQTQFDSFQTPGMTSKINARYVIRLFQHRFSHCLICLFLTPCLTSKRETFMPAINFLNSAFYTDERLYKAKLCNRLQVKVCNFFGAKNVVKKCCQTQHNISQYEDNPMPYLASLFDVMYNVAKLANIVPEINQLTSACNPSNKRHAQRYQHRHPHVTKLYQSMRA